MNLLTNWRLGLVAAVIFTNPLAWAAGMCERVESVDPAIRGRAYSVGFPDGRTLTVVGHNHGVRNISKILSAATDDGLRRLDDLEFAELLSSALTENQTELKLESIGVDLQHASPLNHALWDYDFIQRHAGKPWFRFMGMEASPDFVTGKVPAMEQIRLSIWREYYRRTNLNFPKEDVDKVLLSAMNAPLFAVISKIGLEKRAPLVGMEDPTLLTQFRHSRHLEDVVLAWTTLIANERHHFNLSQAYLDLRQDLFQAAYSMDMDRLDRFDERSQRLLAISPGSLAPQVRNLINALKSRMLYGDARDKAVARKLVEYGASGVHFTGITHLKNTIRHLRILCANEWTSRGVSQRRSRRYKHVFANFASWRKKGVRHLLSKGDYALLGVGAFQDFDFHK